MKTAITSITVAVRRTLGDHSEQRGLSKEIALKLFASYLLHCFLTLIYFPLPLQVFVKENVFSLFDLVLRNEPRGLACTQCPF